MSINFSRKSKRGFTLIEVLVASALFGIASAALCSVYLFSTRSFAAMANYAQLDQVNRLAMDIMTKELREAQAIMDVSTNNGVRINLRNYEGKSVTYSLDGSSGRLLRIEGNTIKVLVSNCKVLEFEVRQRTASTNFDQFPLLGPSDSIQVINLTWKASKNIAGTSIATSEDVQTAHVVVRNQRYVANGNIFMGN